MHLPAWLDQVAPLLDFAALPRVVTLAEAEAQGFPFHVVRRRVRRGTWQRLAPGVYCTDPPVQQVDHLAAASKHGGPGAVVSGTAAVRAYGFRTAPIPDHELLLVPLRCGARSHGRIIVRRSARLPAAEPRPGPPLAPAPRAVIDHARTLPRLDDVRAVVAEAVERAFCTSQELLWEVERGGRRSPVAGTSWTSSGRSCRRSSRWTASNTISARQTGNARSLGISSSRPVATRSPTSRRQPSTTVQVSCAWCAPGSRRGAPALHRDQLARGARSRAGPHSERVLIRARDRAPPRAARRSPPASRW
jgi:hypothetical protein